MTNPTTPTSHERAAGLLGAGLGAVYAGAVTAAGFLTFNPPADIGVYFKLEKDACNRSTALQSARDLGSVSKDTVEKAVHAAVEDWFNGKTATVEIPIPRTPELDKAISAQNRWAATCGGFAPG